MKPNTSKRPNIPGIIVVLIVIIFVGLSLKGGRFVTNHFTGKQQSKNNESPTADKNTNKGSSLLFSRYRQIKQLSDCQIIIQNSLFEQLGGRKIERQVVELPKKVEVKAEMPQSRPAQPNYLVLTGIVYLNGEPLALIEDSSKGKSYFLKRGDKIRNYTVDEITGKEITLVSENSKVVQSLGAKTYYNAEGNLLANGSVVSDSSNMAQVKSMSEPVPSENKDSNLSLIEQMRIRRKKELGQE